MRLRRPEILSMFETLEYGRAPGPLPGQHFDLFDKGTPALGGKAIRKQVMIHLAASPDAPAIQLVELEKHRSRYPSWLPKGRPRWALARQMVSGRAEISSSPPALLTMSSLRVH